MAHWFPPPPHGSVRDEGIRPARGYRRKVVEAVKGAIPFPRSKAQSPPEEFPREETGGDFKRPRPSVAAPVNPKRLCTGSSGRGGSLDCPAAWVGGVFFVRSRELLLWTRPCGPSRAGARSCFQVAAD